MRRVLFPTSEQEAIIVQNIQTRNEAVAEVDLLTIEIEDDLKGNGF